MLESLDDLGDKLKRAQDAYDTTRGRLGSGKGNLVSWVARLEKLGVKTKKEMPTSVRHLLDEDESEPSTLESGRAEQD